MRRCGRPRHGRVERDAKGGAYSLHSHVGRARRTPCTSALQRMQLSLRFIVTACESFSRPSLLQGRRGAAPNKKKEVWIKPLSMSL